MSTSARNRYHFLILTDVDAGHGLCKKRISAHLGPRPRLVLNFCRQCLSEYEQMKYLECPINDFPDKRLYYRYGIEDTCHKTEVEMADHQSIFIAIMLEGT